MCNLIKLKLFAVSDGWICSFLGFDSIIYNIYNMILFKYPVWLLGELTPASYSLNPNQQSHLRTTAIKLLSNGLTYYTAN